MENQAMHNSMMYRLHEKASMGEGCNPNEDHEAIIDMLHRRVASGEGDFMEYGGYAKGNITKAQYMNMMKKRGYTKKQVEMKYKELLKKRRNAANMLAPSAPKKRKSKKIANDWNSFRASYKGRRCTPGQLSDLYARSQGIPRPVRYGPASCQMDNESADQIDILDQATQILSVIKNIDGSTPADIPPAVETIDSAIKIITTRSEQHNPFNILPVENIEEEEQYINTRTGKFLPKNKINQIKAAVKKRDDALKSGQKNSAKHWQTQIDAIYASGMMDDYDDYYDIY
jgi:hypothetical protein